MSTRTTLRYTRPAASWREAMLLGNGHLGAAAWGGVARERIDLNEDTLWTGEPDYEPNPRARAALPEVRELLLAGEYARAQEITAESLGGVGDIATYMPLGELLLDTGIPDEGVSGYHRSLDLDSAIATVQYEHEGITHRRELFASHPAGALVMRVSADRPGSVAFRAGLSSALRHELVETDGSLRMRGRAPMSAFPYTGQTREPLYDESGADRGTRWEARLAALPEGGSARIDGDRLVVEGADAVTLILVARTSYNGPAASPSREGADEAALCEAELRAATERGYDALREEHIADHRALFRRVELDLGASAADELPTDERIRRYRAGSGEDPGLAALYYQFGRYILIATSRPGSQPANLQGVWNPSVNPAWGSNWTINCNAQINYWPVETAGLAECHEPLLQLTRELAESGSRVARDHYGARGWVSHQGTDVWRYAQPGGNVPQWSNFVASNAWLCQHLWEHYAFSGDEAELRRIWPTLRGAAQFHLDMLVEEPEHGWLVTAPDLNFENIWVAPDGRTGSIAMGTTPTTQMVRELFRNVLAAASALGLDDALIGEVEAALPRLAPMQISPTTGQLQEYLDDWTRTMKAEVLSSWGAVCSAQIHPRLSPALAAGLRLIFDAERWWEEKPDPLKGPCLGSWEGAFQANAYARFGDGDAALMILDLHLEKAVQPNLGSKFIGHAPNDPMFQIDGNLGQTAAIGEMLLQSHAGELELLPALPSRWRDGSVRGLRARGGIEVDLAWADGALASATLRATRSQSVFVRRGSWTATVDLAAGVPLTLTGELTPA